VTDVTTSTQRVVENSPPYKRSLNGGSVCHDNERPDPRCSIPENVYRDARHGRQILQCATFRYCPVNSSVERQSNATRLLLLLDNQSFHVRELVFFVSAFRGLTARQTFRA